MTEIGPLEDTHIQPGLFTLCPSLIKCPLFTSPLRFWARTRFHHHHMTFCVEERIGRNVLSHSTNEFMINVLILGLIWSRFGCNDTWHS